MSGSEATLKAINRMQNSGEIKTAKMLEDILALYVSFRRIEFLDMLDLQSSNLSHTT